MATTGFSTVRKDALVGASFLLSLAILRLVAWPYVEGEGRDFHAGHLALFYTHVAGGAGMLVFGAVALRIGLTRHWFGWHRPAGYLYLVTGTIGAMTGLASSFLPNHSPGLSTAMLGAVWLSFTAMAYRAIRHRQIEQHRLWMIRSYVAAWGFVLLRIWLRWLPEFTHTNPIDMIWASWTAPIFLAEILIQWNAGRRVRR